jgi:hypothetical protein
MVQKYLNTGKRHINPKVQTGVVTPTRKMDFLNDGIHRIQNEIIPILQGNRSPMSKIKSNPATWDSLISRTRDVSPSHNQLK